MEVICKGHKYCEDKMDCSHSKKHKYIDKKCDKGGFNSDECYCSAAFLREEKLNKLKNIK